MFLEISEPSLMWLKVNINFRISPSTEKCLIKSTSLLLLHIQKLGLLIVNWDSQLVVDSYCMMSLNASSFKISWISSDDIDFDIFVNLIYRTVFWKFSYVLPFKNFSTCPTELMNHTKILEQFCSLLYLKPLKL